MSNLWVIILRWYVTGKRVAFRILFSGHKMCLKLRHPADHLFYTIHYQNSWCVVEHFLVHIECAISYTYLRSQNVSKIQIPYIPPFL